MKLEIAIVSQEEGFTLGVKVADPPANKVEAVLAQMVQSALEPVFGSVKRAADLGGMDYGEFLRDEPPGGWDR